MSLEDVKANILIVDDKPEKVLALEAVLEELEQNVVKAYSGKEALRHLLQQEFAVILLDVNMPEMDGFETAALLRRRKSSQCTPIIFITAFGDENHISRGYSLGAVDYILAPVIPEVLRTKVSVFVELFRKTDELRRQRQCLERRALQLHKLARAALAINSELAIDKVLQVVVETARDIIGAHASAAVVLPEDRLAHVLRASSFSEKYRHEGWDGLRWETGALHELRGLDGPLRWSRSAEPANPTGTRLLHGLEEWAALLPNLLAAPLKGREGRNMGLLRVADAWEGEFTEDDEALLLQLAQMASIAIENTLFREAREANRMKDEFLATLSHELRTPLNAILGWTTLLRMQKLPAEEAAHGLDVIERNVRAQVRLIDDLLDVSRIARGKLRLTFQTLSLSELVRAAIDCVRKEAREKGLALEFAPAAGSDLITADPDRLQQVLWNILSNALKFTPAGGRIQVAVQQEGGMKEVRISDTGAGIKPEFLPHIFERFRQADGSTTRLHGGLGLGLAISRDLVELHGGTLRAESPGEGLGSTFVIQLPAGVRQAYPLEQKLGGSPAAGGVSLRGVRVLVLDDEKDALETTATVLAKHEAEVLGARSAEEALRLFERHRPRVILSDIAMPQENGFSFLRRLRGLRGGAKVPVLALTALAREEDGDEILAAGFVAHLRKPVDPAELLRQVALAGGEASARTEPAGGNAELERTQSDDQGGVRLFPGFRTS
jgi:signal transduction histidine kinase/DNA-binding NarL/FixJ family response regulator